MKYRIVSDSSSNYLISEGHVDYRTVPLKILIEGKEGYVSAEGILWDETETVYGANVCLKVYTCVRAPENND